MVKEASKKVTHWWFLIW